MSTGAVVAANVPDAAFPDEAFSDEAFSDDVFVDAAFGAAPGTWPLPPATRPRQLWLRAVAAGGQGHYAVAFTDLDRLCRLRQSETLTSLAMSTRASFLRQLGWHDRARRWDGRAAAIAATGEAGADALIGLAADALGVGRFAAAERALDCAAALIEATGSPRSLVRLCWVSAELAMFRGDGATAVDHAARAVLLAADLGSGRHEVKSDVVLAAALCSRGDLDECRREAGRALNRALQLGLVPLQWAVASLLADIGTSVGNDDYSPAQIRELRDSAAETVTRWGGVWRPR